MFDKILVICVGNICRSPTGEGVLKSLLPNKIIASAGVAVEKSHLSGKSADKMALEVALQHDIDISGHCSQQLTTQMCQEYDLLLVMERGHIEAVARIAPQARGKVMLFGEWIGKKDIPDPYRQSQEAFDYAFELINSAAIEWSKRL